MTLAAAYSEVANPTVHTGNSEPQTDVMFQLAEVAVPRKLFAAILERIQCLRVMPGLAPSP